MKPHRARADLANLRIERAEYALMHAAPLPLRATDESQGLLWNSSLQSEKVSSGVGDDELKSEAWGIGPPRCLSLNW